MKQEFKLSPEDVIGLPEYDGPWLNKSGNALLFIEHRFLLDENVSEKTLKLLDLKTETTHTLYQNAHTLTAFWVRDSDRIVIFVEHEGALSTSVLLSDSDLYSTPLFKHVTTLPGRIDGLAAIALREQTILLAFSALTNPSNESQLYNPSAKLESRSSGHVYRNVPCRAADAWVMPERLAIFCLEIDLDSSQPARDSLRNVLSGLDLEYKPYGSIDLTSEGIVVVASPKFPKPDEESLATVYFTKMSDIRHRDHGKAKRLSTQGYAGFSNCPQVLAGGSGIAWLQKPTSWLEDEASHLLIRRRPGGESECSTIHKFYLDVAQEISLSPLSFRLIGEADGVNARERGMEFIEKQMNFVDMKRAVAMGISYGGYMVNWINGQPLGRKFQALVSDCGASNTEAFYTSDSFFFHSHFNGPMYKNKELYQRYNPTQFVEKWSTPVLFISNELDYRVPVTEGIAAYQILRAKNVKCKLLSFPDEAHITTRPGNRLHWWWTVLDWCDEHTS